MIETPRSLRFYLGFIAVLGAAGMALLLSADVYSLRMVLHAVAFGGYGVLAAALPRLLAQRPNLVWIAILGFGAVDVLGYTHPFWSADSAKLAWASFPWGVALAASISVYLAASAKRLAAAQAHPTPA